MNPQLSFFDDPVAPSDARPLGPARVPDDLVRTADRLPAGLRLGTSSWSFPGWAGIVYDRPASDAELARHGLHAYATHPLLRTVGLDRTFYRPMAAVELREMADAVPADFRFLVKAERVLTSPLDPTERSMRSTNPRFLDPAYAADVVIGPTLEGLGSRAGPVVFQLPPTSPNLVGGAALFADRLHAFLGALPRGPIYAVELRTPALFTRAYAKALEATGAAHCYAIHPAAPPLSEQTRALPPFEQPALVVRWSLGGTSGYEATKERFAPFDRIVDEDATTRERITLAVFDALIAEREAFVVVNNKAEGSAPLTVFGLARRLASWEPASLRPPPTGTSARPRPDP